MLTTTLDGLWVLQSLAGIETLCPELGLRPLIPRLDTASRALRHPMAAELAQIGAIDPASGQVDPIIGEWLTVIARRDLSLLVSLSFPGGAPHGQPATRVAINRFASWWVCLERHGDQVRLSSAGTATNAAGAGDVVVGQIERLCGVSAPAPLRPVSLDSEQLLAQVRDRAGLRRYLIGQGLTVEQMRTVMMAADPQVSGLATVVAMQAGVGPEKFARLGIGDGAVLVADTPDGRVVIEHLSAAGRRYQMVAPGGRGEVGLAVLRMIERLPAGEQWPTHRRVV